MGQPQVLTNFTSTPNKDLAFAFAVLLDVKVMQLVFLKQESVVPFSCTLMLGVLL
jgi:hypothetical protein